MKLKIIILLLISLSISCKKENDTIKQEPFLKLFGFNKSLSWKTLNTPVYSNELKDYNFYFQSEIVNGTNDPINHTIHHEYILSEQLLTKKIDIYYISNNEFWQPDSIKFILAPQDEETYQNVRLLLSNTYKNDSNKFNIGSYYITLKYILNKKLIVYFCKDNRDF